MEHDINRRLFELTAEECSTIGLDPDMPAVWSEDAAAELLDRVNHKLSGILDIDRAQLPNGSLRQQFVQKVTRQENLLHNMRVCIVDSGVLSLEVDSPGQFNG